MADDPSGSTIKQAAGSGTGAPPVRRARPDDGPAIGRVHVAAWRAAYREVMPAVFLDGLEPTERGERWRATLTAASVDPADHPATFVVPGADGDVEGFALVGAARDADVGIGVGELWAINVEPAAWGSGAGPALLARAREALIGRGYVESVLWVVERNPRARRFYEREGWSADGAVRTEEIGGTAVREVRYRCGLAASNGSAPVLWAEFTAATGFDGPHSAWAFGGDDDPALADELVGLVLTGTKRATASLPTLYEREGEPLPAPGDHSVLLDGRGRARCVIETTEVEVRPFGEVDERFAADEGEGDRTLAWWRDAHRRFFGSQGTVVDDATPVVCERFELRWPGPRLPAGPQPGG
ncbi:MAG: GNAT family N-acetyltransferase [Actinomycetota bacterium]|nr:GNAT family N-acetyltransferase [Actinomycetota bacterium]